MPDSAITISAREYNELTRRLSAVEAERNEARDTAAYWVRRCQGWEARVEALSEALDLVDTPYPIEVFPERTDEERGAIFTAMREVDQYATEWFYAHVARERGRVARAALAALPVPETQP